MEHLPFLIISNESIGPSIRTSIRSRSMQIAVTFRHMETDEGVKGYVKEKVQRLQKYIESLREVHVVLSVEKFQAHCRDYHHRKRDDAQQPGEE